MSIIAVITGLSLGLKRKGKDIISDAKKDKKDGKKTTPWIPNVDAGGEALVTIGDNLYIIVGGLLILVAYRRRIQVIISLR